MMRWTWCTGRRAVAVALVLATTAGGACAAQGRIVLPSPRPHTAGRGRATLPGVPRAHRAGLGPGPSPGRGLVPFALAAREAYRFLTHSRINLSERELPPGRLGAYVLPGYVNPRALVHGLPVVNYLRQGFCGIPGVAVVTPTAVANAAIAYWNLYFGAVAHGARRMARANLMKFLRLARWLLAHQRRGAWPWPIPVPCYGILHAGWLSALTQGEGVSVLLRAYQVTGRRAYLQVAAQAVGYLERPLSRGGLLGRLGSGWWPQEYVTSRGIGLNVLNGGISAVLGLWEYARVTQSRAAWAAFRLTTRTLAQNLGRFRFPGWARYQAYGPPLPAPLPYMSLQIHELRALYALTGYRALRRMARLWQEEITPGQGERAAAVQFWRYTRRRRLTPAIAW